MTYFPQAKVILTDRSPESWWESFEKTILAHINRQTDPESLVATLVARQVFDGRPNDRSHAISRYEANVRDVKESVPEGKLLVHNLGDGWESLCAHLGVPKRREPYPNRNSADQIRAAFMLN